MRQIIIHGLRSEFDDLIIAINGQVIEPTLIELENILANQEKLDKQMLGVSIKNGDKALYIKKGNYFNKGHSSTKFQPQENKTKRSNNWQQRQKKKSYQQGGAC